jgi:hypothetical protein
LEEYMSDEDHENILNSSENDLPVKILIDEFEIEPFLDFDRYVRTIVRIVKGSEPNFLLEFMDSGELARQH